MTAIDTPHGSSAWDSCGDIDPRSLRIAVVQHHDPEDPAASSGRASLLIAALRNLGVAVYPVSGAPPPAVATALAGVTVARWMLTGARVTGPPYQRRELAELATESSVVLGRLAKSRLARQQPVDAAIVVAASQLGPLRGVPYATYDDMTVQQAVRHPAWVVSRLPKRDLDARRQLQERQFQAARVVCTNTWWARDSVVEDYGVDPAKVHVVGFGGRQRDGADGSGHARTAAPRFLYTGLDWARKNGEVILQAFGVVRREHPEAMLDIVGHPERIDHPGVRWHGFLGLADSRQQHRLKELFSAATCFLMPSEVEPAGKAVLEAASCGVPSIVTSVGGATEAVGEGGLTVEPGDPAALAQAMLRMCDLEFAARLGELARRHVKQFTWELTARRILSALGLGPAMDELPRVMPETVESAQ